MRSRPGGSNDVELVFRCDACSERIGLHALVPKPDAWISDAESVVPHAKLPSWAWYFSVTELKYAEAATVASQGCPSANWEHSERRQTESCKTPIPDSEARLILIK